MTPAFCRAVGFLVPSGQDMVDANKTQTAILFHEKDIIHWDRLYFAIFPSSISSGAQFVVCSSADN